MLRRRQRLNHSDVNVLLKDSFLMKLTSSPLTVCLTFISSCYHYCGGTDGNAMFSFWTSEPSETNPTILYIGSQRFRQVSSFQYLELMYILYFTPKVTMALRVEHVQYDIQPPLLSTCITNVNACASGMCLYGVHKCVLFILQDKSTVCFMQTH